METHPLRGTTRWLIYPLLALVAGCLPGLMVDLHERLGTFANTIIGGAMGGAVAIGVSLSARKWVGLLVAPPLGALGFIGAWYVLPGGWTWGWVVSETLNQLRAPGLMGTTFLLTAPLVGLHWFRRSRAGPWAFGWIVYPAGPGLLWLLAVCIGTATGQWIHLAFVALFNLGSRAAWDWALKLSAAQLGRPSSRVASS